MVYYKAGISNDWEVRFSQLARGLPDRLVLVKGSFLRFTLGKEAMRLEKIMLRISKEQGWNAPKRDFDGGTELFLNDPLEYALLNDIVDDSHLHGSEGASN